MFTSTSLHWMLLDEKEKHCKELRMLWEHVCPEDKAEALVAGDFPVDGLKLPLWAFPPYKVCQQMCSAPGKWARAGGTFPGPRPRLQSLLLLTYWVSQAAD